MVHKDDYRYVDLCSRPIDTTIVTIQNILRPYLDWG